MAYRFGLFLRAVLANLFAVHHAVLLASTTLDRRCLNFRADSPHEGVFLTK